MFVKILQNDEIQEGIQKVKEILDEQLESKQEENVWKLDIEDVADKSFIALMEVNRMIVIAVVDSKEQLEFIGVDKEYRQKGKATYLLKTLAEIYPNISAEIRPDYLAFFRKAGFQEEIPDARQVLEKVIPVKCGGAKEHKINKWILLIVLLIFIKAVCSIAIPAFSFG